MKTKAERSFEACSDVLRIVIRAGAEKLKKKTVKAVIEHITQLLPATNGDFCAGLSQFYLKVLGALLEYEVHVEHLEAEDWIGTVDFCLQGINNYETSGSPEDLLPSHPSASSTLVPSSSTRTSTTRLSVRAASSGTTLTNISRKNSEELLDCLLSLISASNAPILERIEEILQGIMHFLSSHGFLVSSIHQVAFSALNLGLSTMDTDRALLAQSLAPDIIPIIARLWSSKSLSKDEMLNSVKDEMLVTIFLLQLHMERIVSEHVTTEFQEKIEELEMVLRNDYVRRTDRDQLQLEDLDLGTICEDSEDVRTSIQVGGLRLRPHVIRAERKWAILNCLCILDGLLHIQSTATVQTGSHDKLDDSKHPRKRRRILHPVDGLVARISCQDTGERLVALQTLLFLLPTHQLPKEALGDLITQIMPYLGDKREGIGSWAMLALAL